MADQEMGGATEFKGVCHSIKDAATETIRGLGATVGLLEEAMKEACEGNCLICPVELRRKGTNAVMTAAHTTIYGITSGWQNIADIMKADQDS